MCICQPFLTLVAQKDTDLSHSRAKGMRKKRLTKWMGEVLTADRSQSIVQRGELTVLLLAVAFLPHVEIGFVDNVAGAVRVGFHMNYDHVPGVHVEVHVEVEVVVQVLAQLQTLARVQVHVKDMIVEEEVEVQVEPGEEVQVAVQDLQVQDPQGVEKTAVEVGVEAVGTIATHKEEVGGMTVRPRAEAVVDKTMKEMKEMAMAVETDEGTKLSRIEQLGQDAATWASGPA